MCETKYLLFWWVLQAFVPIHCSRRGRNHISLKKVNFHKRNKSSDVESAQEQKPLPAPLTWCLGPRTWFCSYTVMLGPISWPTAWCQQHLPVLTAQGRAPRWDHPTSITHQDRNLLIKMPRRSQQVDWNIFCTGKQNKSQQVKPNWLGRNSFHVPHLPTD